MSKFVYSSPIIIGTDLSKEQISKPFDVRHLNNIAVQVAWTGNPQGKFRLESSLDFLPDGGIQTGQAGLLSANPKVAGTWTDVSDLIEITGAAAGNKMFQLQHIGLMFLRLHYVPDAAVAGTLTLALFAGKAL